MHTISSAGNFPLFLFTQQVLTQALRFSDKIDLGGTWATLSYDPRIDLSTSSSVAGSTVTFKDELIQTSFEIQDQFGLGVPVDGETKVILGTVDDADDDVIISGNFITGDDEVAN